MNAWLEPDCTCMPHHDHRGELPGRPPRQHLQGMIAAFPRELDALPVEDGVRFMVRRRHEADLRSAARDARRTPGCQAHLREITYAALDRAVPEDWRRMTVGQLRAALETGA
jgi:hypothetical protein